jgi:hypothetical protein
MERVHQLQDQSEKIPEQVEFSECCTWRNLRRRHALPSWQSGILEMHAVVAKVRKERDHSQVLEVLLEVAG